MLRMPCSDDREGLVAPHDLVYNSFSIYSILSLFLSEASHRHCLMTSHLHRRLMDPIALAYCLSAVVHQSNLRGIESRIREIAFRQLKSDDEGDLQLHSKTLHQQREEIVILQSHVAHAMKSMHPKTRQYLSRLPLESCGHGPLVTLEEVQRNAADLQRFLMDTFQLLTSTINIKDARLSIEQAARTAMLTQLAAIYLPLTLVTGIFGMNIREITRDDPSWWVCVVALVCVALLTSALMWLQSAWRRYGSKVIYRIRTWGLLHHCGKRVWKWLYERWYDMTKG